MVNRILQDAYLAAALAEATEEISDDTDYAEFLLAVIHPETMAVPA